MTKIVGLRTDHLPIEQPRESARFVLNGALDSPNGDVFNYQNELGTELNYTLPTGYKLIGAINLANDEVVIFSTDNTTSEIGLFNKGTYTTLVNTECLAFNTSNPIRGEFKLLNGCDRVIYWTDNLNPDRQLNIDSLSSYQDSLGEWDCNLFKLNPDYLVPYISDVTVNDTGGTLDSGSYSFAVEILDDNLNSIAVGLATPYMPVYADSQSSSYQSINGNFSSTFNAPEGGATTSKSFTLTLTNLDTRFAYARIIVAARTSGRGLAEEAYETIDYLPITKSTLSYTFTGLDNVTRTDIDRIKIKNPKYTTSKALTQIDGRLVRANVREKRRDYSAYQRTANNITAQWVRKAEFAEDIAEGHNSKNPKSYFTGNTFIGDEIYAFGIVYVYSDGSFSPAFHIPGREANTTDTETLTVVTTATTGTNINENDAEHLGLQAGQTTPRWKFYNTATGVTSGSFGYHESETGTYPLDLDCNGEYIYGGLAGTPIRHHRFPDRKKVPVQFTNSAGQARVNKLGVQFSGVTYPDSDIVGHFFVKAKRDVNDSTVLDMVTVGYHTDNEDRYVFQNASSGTDNTEIVALQGASILRGILPQFDYINIIGYYSTSADEGSFELDTYIGSLGIGVRDMEYEDNLSTIQSIYRQATNTRIINSNSVYNGVFDRPVVNESFSNKIAVTTLNSPVDYTRFEYTTTLLTATLKRTADVYNNLYLLEYEPITEIVTGIIPSYRGGGFINDIDRYDLEFAESGGATRLFARYHNKLLIESGINYNLKVEGTGQYARYNKDADLVEYTANRYLDYDGSSWVVRGNIYPEYYAYNEDYSPMYPGEILLPVSFNYDYCSECLAKYPNRIIWSPKSFSEEKSDTYRINLVNDYTTVGENKGEITAIHYDKNRMIVLTESTCLLMSPNPRVINTDADTAYIGTGDFLGIPPAEFAKTDYGFGGCQGRFSYTNTEHGFFWCDQRAGRLFNFNGQIDELSSKQYGNYNFFRQNLPSVLDTQGYTSTDSTVSGIGVQLSYDPYYKRLLINKIDYRYLGIEDIDGDFADHGKYENLSFTLSYSPELKTFISFHSWHPEFMFSDRSTLYTTTPNNIWAHTKFESEFYGSKFPFTVEYVEANPQTTNLETVQFYAQVIDNTGFDKDYRSFDTLWCYSANQSTGEQNLVPKSDYPKFWDNTQKVIVHAEDNYRVSALRDISTGSAVASTAWSDKQSRYQGKQGYVDRVPVNINTGMSQWKLIPLKNKYHIIRLSYSGSDRLIFNITETVTKPSYL